MVVVVAVHACMVAGVRPGLLLHCVLVVAVHTGVVAGVGPDLLHAAIPCRLWCCGRHRGQCGVHLAAAPSAFSDPMGVAAAAACTVRPQDLTLPSRDGCTVRGCAIGLEP